MTMFAIEPYKKITVRTYMKYDSPEIFVIALTGGLPRGIGGKVGNLFWANGILFKHYAYASTDSVSKQHLRGYLPIDHIEYAVMPEFRSEIRADDMAINVINVSNHSLFKDLTKWIAQKLEKKNKLKKR